jgi:hypothetical protein
MSAYLGETDIAIWRRQVSSEPEGDMRPDFHSITSSATASSDGGTVRPSALAVLRLITSAYGESVTVLPFRPFYQWRPLLDHS